MALAPERTRRRKNSEPDKPNLLNFKKGSFHLAKLAQKRLIPVAITGSGRIGQVGKFAPRSGTIWVKLLDPIELDVINSKTVDELIKHTRDKMLEGVEIKTDEEVFGEYYDGWGALCFWIVYNLAWVLFFKWLIF